MLICPLSCAYLCAWTMEAQRSLRIVARNATPQTGCRATMELDLELAEHMVGAADGEVAGRFDVELFNNAVIDYH